MTPEEYNNEGECYLILYKYLGMEPILLSSFIMRSSISSNISVILQSSSSAMKKERNILEAT